MQSLVEKKEGVILPGLQAARICNGIQKLIINSKICRSIINKPVYLLDENLCHGIIKLCYPYKINREEFIGIKEVHMLTETDYNKWWGNKEILFAYNFSLIAKFDEPKKIIKCESDDIYASSFDFVEEENIKDISGYNPSEINNKQLADDWRIINAFYSTKRAGGKIKHSIEDIINTAGIIYREIIRRVKEGTMKHTFEPDKMTDLSKELYYIVSKGKTGITEKQKTYSAYQIYEDEFIDDIKSKSLASREEQLVNILL